MKNNERKRKGENFNDFKGNFCIQVNENWFWGIKELIREGLVGGDDNDRRFYLKGLTNVLNAPVS